MRVVKPQISHCLDLLALLADSSRGMRLTDLTVALDEPKSSVQRLLGHLIGEGWVEQDPDTTHYRLTLRLATLGQRHLQAIGITDASQAILQRLARQTRELVRLTIVDGNRLVWIGSAQGAAPGLMYQPEMGHHIVSFATANGKAWLATLGPAEALRIAKADGLGLAATRAVTGPRALASAEALRRDLTVVRARGYGLAVEEAEPGVTAVAVPILRRSSQTAIGTVSVAGPSVRMRPEAFAELAGLLRTAAAELAAVWPGIDATDLSPKVQLVQR
jgi:DNA-binding IclR family transcriptional regulator